MIASGEATSADAAVGLAVVVWARAAVDAASNIAVNPMVLNMPRGATNRSFALQRLPLVRDRRIAVVIGPLADHEPSGGMHLPQREARAVANLVVAVEH